MGSTKTQSKMPDESERLLRLERMAARDDAEEVAAMSSENVATALRAEGGDPDAIGERGASFMMSLLTKHSAKDAVPAWKAEATARARVATEAAKKAPKVTGAGLPRAELLRRLTAARKDPHLGASVTAAFRSRAAAASSDAELAALLDEITELAAIAATGKSLPSPKPPKAPAREAAPKRKAIPKKKKKR